LQNIIYFVSLIISCLNNIFFYLAKQNVAE
jgi:hypothetical protein